MNDQSSPSADAVEEEQKNEETKSSRTFPCYICGKIMTQASALGGHVSRAHKGMSDAYNRNMAIRKQREKPRLVNTYSKKLLSHVEGIEDYRSTNNLMKDIRSHLMTFEISQLNDELVEELSNSEWFAELKQELYASKKKDKKEK